MHGKDYIAGEIDSKSVVERHSASTVLSDILNIVKAKITIFVAFTTSLGYILAADTLTLHFIYPVLGIFILACSSAALNQFQERNTDKLMARTVSRPIPGGRMKPYQVLFISFFLLICGSLLLILETNIATLAVGLVTFFWYNAVYTPLKKKMALAIIPGSLVGALPPVAGWVAAGGDILDPKILFVAFFFFIWQIPHFWLLLLKFGKDYEDAGFPTLTAIMSKEKIVKLTFILTVLTALTACFFTVTGLVNYTLTNILIILASVWLSVSSYNFYKSSADAKDVIKSFISINIYTLLIITLLSVDKLVKLI